MRRGEWIGTYTGKHFYIIDPRPEEVCIEDIAHALSQICRFNGHSVETYSVAVHCLNVERYLNQHGYDKLIRLYGLLHDAPEAYIGDITRPLKKCLGEGAVEKIESRIMDAIYAHFGIPKPGADAAKAVKDADDYILACEAKRYMVNAREWGLLPQTEGYTLAFSGDLTKEEAEAFYTYRVSTLLESLDEVKL